MLHTLAAYRGWALSVIPAYNQHEPPTYVLEQIDGPLACGFNSLERLTKHLLNEEQK